MLIKCEINLLIQAPENLTINFSRTTPKRPPTIYGDSRISASSTEQLKPRAGNTFRLLSSGKGRQIPNEKVLRRLRYNQTKSWKIQ